jgi:hypothetical protein
VMVSMRRLSAAVSLALALAFAALPAQANHPNDDPSRAFRLNGPVSGEIEGAPPNLGAGRFAFYTFQVPAGGAALTVEADITPGDLVSASRAGFKVYGPTAGKLYAEGAQTSTHPSHRADVTATEAGTYALQIFNFNVTPVHYDVTVSGLPPQPEVLPTQEAASAPPSSPTATPVVLGDNTSPDQAAELPDSVSTTLRGSAAGSFHFYRLDYPGDNSPVQFTLGVDPPDAGTLLTTGLIVYGPTGGREYLKIGYEARVSPQAGAFRSNERGTYVVQVGNYGPRSVAYQLDVTRGS